MEWERVRSIRIHEKKIHARDVTRAWLMVTSRGRRFVIYPKNFFFWSPFFFYK